MGEEAGHKGANCLKLRMIALAIDYAPNDFYRKGVITSESGDMLKAITEKRIPSEEALKTAEEVCDMYVVITDEDYAETFDYMINHQIHDQDKEAYKIKHFLIRRKTPVMMLIKDRISRTKGGKEK